MSAHTPGPWHFTAPTETLHAVRSTNGIVADVGYSRTLEANDANARLIAAAPDMFDALQDALASLEISGQSDYVTGRVRAAIAKARGEA